MKGFIGLTAVIILVAVATVGTILFVPGVATSIQSVVGIKQPCFDAPLDPNCFCADNEDRLSLIAYGIPKFICEKKNKFIDPDAEGWEQQAINYVTQKLNSEYPECTMKTCSEGEWIVALTAMNYEKRVISVECRSLDQVFVDVKFYVESGETWKVSCADYRPPPTGTPTMEITFSKTGPGYNMAKLFVDLKCSEGTGTVTRSYTYYLPEVETNWMANTATDWWFHGIGYPQTYNLGGGFADMGTCILKDKTSKSVTVECTAECTGYSDWGETVTLRYS